MEQKNLPEYLVEADDGSYIDVTLTRDASFSGVTKRVLRMREPGTADMENFQNAKGEAATREINTLANLCEATPAEIRAIPYKGYLRLQEAFTRFIS